MNMHSRTATGRGWLAVGALLAVSMLAPPVHAACNANSYKANPTSATIVQEYNASSSYQPILVTLGVNKALSDGVVITWTQLQGAAVTLNTTNPALPTFLTPSVPAAGSVLRFQLRATCPGGSTAVDNTATITIVNVNRPPVAYVSAAPSTAYVGDTVTLNSTAPSGTPASSDPDGDTLSYQWTQTAGSPTATLVNPNSATASFVAPSAASSYSLTFQLLVTDPGGLFNTQSVIVNVTANVPPMAKLVCPEFVDEGEQNVVLDGSTSTPGSGGALSYTWTQLQGSPEIVIGGATGNSVGFDAPSLTATFDGYLEFQLHVANSAGEDLATCATQIVDVTDPVITVPADITVEATSAAGEMVTYYVEAQDAAEDHVPYELLTCDPPSGSLFHLAAAPIQSNTTTVVCAASDLAGNTAAADFDITVRDTTAPVITVPGSFAVEATGPSGAVANYTATKLDAVDGAGNADCQPVSGSTFAITTTLVTCSATDARNNAAALKSFNLTVHDTLKPVISGAASQILEATSPAGAVATFELTAADIADPSVPVICSANSGDVFPLGSTTVNCTATDDSTNQATASFSVTVVDTIAPVISGAAAANQTLEATSPDGAIATFALTASDVADLSVPVLCSPAPGSTFGLGITPVTCTATDDSGNQAEASFAITVEDTTAPVIAGDTDDQTLEATSPAGAIATFALTAADIADPSVPVVCSASSGDTFPLGTTTVNCTATDDSTNQATASFSVTVVDTIAPVISGAAAANQTLEATSPAGAIATFALTAADIADPSVPVVCSANSGDTFPLGTTTVNCTATDDSTNQATASFSVTVVDTIAPVISGATAANQTLEATSPAGAIATFALTAADIADPSVPVVCSASSGDTFPLGSTTVNCTATDDSTNQATASFTIQVEDTTKPVINAHGNEVREATGPGGAVVTYTSPGTFDVVDVGLVATCAPASGNTFALGAHAVTCNAADGAGNVAVATTFTVTVRDTTAPAITPHADVNALASGNSSAVVDYTPLPTANDLVDGAVTVSCLPASGSTFNVGATTVTCTAQDGRVPANVATSTFQVNVSYSFNGFFRPIDNLPTINVVKAGSAIPVKFSLGGNQGLNIFAANYPASVSTACSASQTDAVEETVTAGSSSLQYDPGADQYIYVWKTDKSWTGCRQLQVKLRDGSSRWAVFSFTR